MLPAVNHKTTQTGGKLLFHRNSSFRLRAAVLLVATAPFLSSAGCHWSASGKNALGAQLHEQGQYTAALQQFQQVVADDPTNPDGYYNLAATTHQLAKQRNDEALYANAEALYNQCLDHDPNHIECHRGLAVLLMDTGRPDKAFALVKNWASQNPMDSQPRVELARLYEEAGEPQTALKYLEDAVQQDANNSRAWLALARLRESTGDLPQALQNYQHALALNNSQPMIAERVAAISQKLNSDLDAAHHAAATQIAQPLPYGNTSRY
ncbi:tetratricopeptide repeat protein [Stieleria sp. TO1_6]|uniref:tetratricopeptide repeat protein n=1 Tax=Stieleria tagensis TaxID=2956795 RepID=UPI00209B3465|nr:tetratricopeptide repeat protein [Stieleria tagensis]MCO8123945.1 tetratricopeptide repeat protein [Stieleria tagensis]